MADVGSLAVNLKVNSAGLVEGLKVASTTVDGVAQSYRTSFGHVGSSVASAAKEHLGFLGVLKEFKGEQVQQARTARFYAQEIASIIPAAEGAKNSISDMVGVGIEALAGGFSLGLAFEGVKLAIGYFHDLAEAEKKALEEWKAYVDAAHEDTKKFTANIKDLIAAMDGVSRAEQLLSGSLGGKGGLSERQAELEAKRNQALKLKQVVDSPGAGEGITDFSVVRARRKEVNDYLAELDRQLEAVHREITERSIAADELDARDEQERQWELERSEIASLHKVADEMLRVREAELRALREFDQEELADVRAIEKAKNEAFLAVRAEQDRKEQARTGEKARKEDGEVDALRKRYQPLVGIAESVASTWAAAFQGMLSGADSFGDGMARVFDGILQSFLSMITQMIAKVAIFGLLNAVTGGMFSTITGGLGAFLGLVAPPFAGATPALGGGGGNLVLNVHAVDGASVYRMVSSPAFAGAVREARRNGVL